MALPANNYSLVGVLLAGGIGSRLWPVSREAYPKQFSAILDGSDNTMLQQTVKRLGGSLVNRYITLCNEDHRFLVEEQLKPLEIQNEIILEPDGRNTAPAIALAALQASSAGDDPILVVLPCDHQVTDRERFGESLKVAIDIAEKGRLVTFGISATYAETGYGYIETGREVIGGGFEVLSFLEKPDLETAERFVQGGKHLWNGGMFVFRASVYLEELAKWEPKILANCSLAMEKAKLDLSFIKVASQPFLACDNKSIDHAVMENTELATVVSLDAGWSDLGSWSSVWKASSKTESNNASVGNVAFLNTNNSLVVSESRLVGLVGVSDLSVIETKDALLVCSNDATEDVKNLAAQLRASGMPEASTHREVFRPWGKFDSVKEGDRFKVKQLTVKPGAKLSLQKHYHRAEHWVVVAGTATITIGEEKFVLTENQSTYIPVGETHSLENAGIIDLEIIEVQTGSYLGEDDIVRLEDIYGRVDGSADE